MTPDVSEPAAMLKRHRDVVRAIVDQVPLGLLIAFQLADDYDLVDNLTSGIRSAAPRLANFKL